LPNTRAYAINILAIVIGTHKDTTLIIPEMQDDINEASPEELNDIMYWVNYIEWYNDGELKKPKLRIA
jgi:hypothetical protein